MPDAKTLKNLHAAIEQAEYALTQLGDDLLFQVKPEGGLEIVRRGPDGLPAEPEAMVADLAGADSLLWQAARPEGAITLGRPYVDPQPRCALSGRPLSRGAPVELYYQGRPVDTESALAFSPRLVYLQGMTYFLSALLYELRADPPPSGEAAKADEARAAAGAAKVLLADFLAQLRALAKGAGRKDDPAAPLRWEDPDPKPDDVPEEN